MEHEGTDRPYRPYRPLAHAPGGVSFGMFPAAGRPRTP
jgi:hypothetical protein